MFFNIPSGFLPLDIAKLSFSPTAQIRLRPQFELHDSKLLRKTNTLPIIDDDKIGVGEWQN